MNGRCSCCFPPGRMAYPHYCSARSHHIARDGTIFYYGTFQLSRRVQDAFLRSLEDSDPQEEICLAGLGPHARCGSSRQQQPLSQSRTSGSKMHQPCHARSQHAFKPSNHRAQSYANQPQSQPLQDSKAWRGDAIREMAISCESTQMTSSLRNQSDYHTSAQPDELAEFRLAPLPASRGSPTSVLGLQDSSPAGVQNLPGARAEAQLRLWPSLAPIFQPLQRQGEGAVEGYQSFQGLASRDHSLGDTSKVFTNPLLEKHRLPEERSSELSFANDLAASLHCGKLDLTGKFARQGGPSALQVCVRVKATRSSACYLHPFYQPRIAPTSPFPPAF